MNILKRRTMVNKLKLILTAKTALIFGASGQDGSLISKSLLKKGFRVIGLSRLQTKQPIKNHLILGIEKEVEMIDGDIEKYSTISSLIEKYQPREIYNLAGQSSVGESFRHPRKTLKSIINGSHNILETCRKLDFKGSIFFAGSSEIFGNMKKPASIEDVHQPINPYAISKSTSFNLVKLYREVYGLKCMTGVLFNHESPLRKSSFVTQKIISGAIECKKGTTKVLKLGNLEIARDWGWAPEYVEAMQLIANSEMMNDQIICTGKLTTLKKFIEIAFKKLDLDWQEYVTSDKKLFRETEIENSCGDPSKIFKELGWKTKISVDSIIEKLIDFKERN